MRISFIENIFPWQYIIKIIKEVLKVKNPDRLSVWSRKCSISLKTKWQKAKASSSKSNNKLYEPTQWGITRDVRKKVRSFRLCSVDGLHTEISVYKRNVEINFSITTWVMCNFKPKQGRKRDISLQINIRQHVVACSSNKHQLWHPN